MDKHKQELIGSPSRDLFKYLHKKLSPRLYATDLDFVLIGRAPYRIIGFVDVKKTDEPLTFAEVVGYNRLKEIAPVYIYYTKDVENGPFEIYQYQEGDPAPEPPRYSQKRVAFCKTWDDLENWELKLRGLEDKVVPVSLKSYSTGKALQLADFC